LKLLDLFKKEGIILDLNALSKNEVIQKIAELAVSIAPSIDKDEVFKVIREREDLGSTGIGDGVAIPHGKLQGLDDLTMLIMRSLGGVPFDAVDNRPAHILICLLAPENMASLYLKALAGVSRFLKTDGVYENIMNAADEESLIQIIKEAVIEI
jgi:PTS system nitrogen regulatory IIA component